MQAEQINQELTTSKSLNTTTLASPAGRNWKCNLRGLESVTSNSVLAADRCKNLVNRLVIRTRNNGHIVNVKKKLDNKTSQKVALRRGACKVGFKVLTCGGGLSARVLKGAPSTMRGVRDDWRKMPSLRGPGGGMGLARGAWSTEGMWAVPLVSSYLREAAWELHNKKSREG